MKKFLSFVLVFAMIISPLYFGTYSAYANSNDNGASTATFNNINNKGIYEVVSFSNISDYLNYLSKNKNTSLQQWIKEYLQLKRKGDSGVHTSEMNSIVIGDGTYNVLWTNQEHYKVRGTAAPNATVTIYVRTHQEEKKYMVKANNNGNFTATVVLKWGSNIIYASCNKIYSNSLEVSYFPNTYPSTLRVKFVDPNGNMLPNSRVTVSSDYWFMPFYKTATTDEEGIATFDNVPSVQFVIEANSYNWKGQTQAIVLPNQINDITLNAKFHIEHTLVVSTATGATVYLISRDNKVLDEKKAVTGTVEFSDVDLSRAWEFSVIARKGYNFSYMNGIHGWTYKDNKAFVSIPPLNKKVLIVVDDNSEIDSMTIKEGVEGFLDGIPAIKNVTYDIYNDTIPDNVISQINGNWLLWLVGKSDATSFTNNDLSKLALLTNKAKIWLEGKNVAKQVESVSPDYLASLLHVYPGSDMTVDFAKLYLTKNIIGYLSNNDSISTIVPSDSSVVPFVISSSPYHNGLFSMYMSKKGFVGIYKLSSTGYPFIFTTLGFEDISERNLYRFANNLSRVNPLNGVCPVILKSPYLPVIATGSATLILDTYKGANISLKINDKDMGSFTANDNGEVVVTSTLTNGLNSLDVYLDNCHTSLPVYAMAKLEGEELSLATVTITVVDKNGSPVKGIAVALYNDDIKGGYLGFHSDNQGHVVIPNVAFSYISLLGSIIPITNYSVIVRGDNKFTKYSNVINYGQRQITATLMTATINIASDTSDFDVTISGKGFLSEDYVERAQGLPAMPYWFYWYRFDTYGNNVITATSLPLVDEYNISAFSYGKHTSTIVFLNHNHTTATVSLNFIDRSLPTSTWLLVSYDEGVVDKYRSLLNAINVYRSMRHMPLIKFNAIVISESDKLVDKLSSPGSYNGIIFDIGDKGISEDNVKFIENFLNSGGRLWMMGSGLFTNVYSLYPAFVKYYLGVNSYKNYGAGILFPHGEEGSFVLSTNKRVLLRLYPGANSLLPWNNEYIITSSETAGSMIKGHYGLVVTPFNIDNLPQIGDLAMENVAYNSPTTSRLISAILNKLSNSVIPDTPNIMLSATSSEGATIAINGTADNYLVYVNGHLVAETTSNQVNVPLSYGNNYIYVVVKASSDDGEQSYYRSNILHVFKPVSNTSIVTGVVKAYGDPVKGAVIKLQSDNYVYTSTTATGGVYTIDNVVPGNYIVTAESEYPVGKWTGTITVTENATITQNIELSTPPTVKILTPTVGYTATADFMVKFKVKDYEEDVYKITLYIDGVPLKEIMEGTGTYTETINVTNLSYGKHTLKIVAEDKYGNTGADILTFVYEEYNPVKEVNITLNRGINLVGISVEDGRTLGEILSESGIDPSSLITFKYTKGRFMRMSLNEKLDPYRGYLMFALRGNITITFKGQESDVEKVEMANMDRKGIFLVGPIPGKKVGDISMEDSKGQRYDVKSGRILVFKYTKGRFVRAGLNDVMEEGKSYLVFSLVPVKYYVVK